MARSMKAITPVIATIVLLLITVAIAGSAWNYISGYWSGTVDKQIEVTDAFCVGTNQAKVLVRNIGTGAVSTGDITVLNKTSGTDISDDVKWASDVADSNLLLELKFDEGTGTVARDTSGKGHDGVLFGSPQWVAGKSGGGMDFDHAGDYVNVSGRDFIEMGRTLNTYTLSAWVKTSMALGGDAYIIDKWNAMNRYPFNFRIQDVQWYSMWWNGTGPNGCGTSSIGLDPNDGVWHLLTATYDLDAGIIRIYSDGKYNQAITICTVIGTIWNDADILLAQYGSSEFIGTLDDVRIYNRVLGDDEIRALADNAILVQPGDTATMTQACGGRCDYRIMLGGRTLTAIVEC